MIICVIKLYVKYKGVGGENNRKVRVQEMMMRITRVPRDYIPTYNFMGIYLKKIVFA